MLPVRDVSNQNYIICMFLFLLPNIFDSLRHGEDQTYQCAVGTVFFNFQITLAA